MTSPNEEEVAQGGKKVELYQCSVASCGMYVRFPRLSDAAAILKTRKGRLGEGLLALLSFAEQSVQEYGGSGVPKTWIG